jgi:hypothetical protein
MHMPCSFNTHPVKPGYDDFSISLYFLCIRYTIYTSIYAVCVCRYVDICNFVSKSWVT